MIDFMPWLLLGGAAAYAVVVYGLVRSMVRRAKPSTGESKAMLYALSFGGMLASVFVASFVGAAVPEAVANLLVAAMLVGAIAAFFAVVMA